MDSILLDLRQWLLHFGISEELAKGIKELIFIAILVIISWALYYISRFIVSKIVKRLVRNTTTKFDDYLFEQKFFSRLVLLVPSIFLCVAIPTTIDAGSSLLYPSVTIVRIFIVFVITLSLQSFIKALGVSYDQLDIAKTKSIKAYIQTGNLVLYVIAILIVISMLLKIPVLALLTGLGAFMAILVLVFKDPILGFVGGIQINSYNIIKIGDWVTLNKYDVDGDVIDISLTTVKIQNFDKTISTVPTYTFVSEPVKNWRGMQDLGSRRIMRDFNIDMTSIQFCTQEMLDEFSKIDYIKRYIDETQLKIDNYNKENNINDDTIVNGMRQTNVGILRAYLLNYLKHHPKVNQGLTLMVRQMPATPNGLPIQIYCFASTTNWEEYEGVLSDIFDHILATVPYFKLQLFQNPTGLDLRTIGDAKK